MFTIRADNLKETALEDIVEIINKKPKNNEEYLTNETVGYIQAKFSISNEELKKYLKKWHSIKELKGGIKDEKNKSSNRRDYFFTI